MEILIIALGKIAIAVLTGIGLSTGFKITDMLVNKYGKFSTKLKDNLDNGNMSYTDGILAAMELDWLTARNYATATE